MNDFVDISKPLMPKATAVWLIENTALTFTQIGDFCGLPEIEIQALADEEVGLGIVGRNPLEHGELNKETIERCEADPSARLKMAKSELPAMRIRAKGPRYTPVTKRSDKPDAVAYILKHHPEISEAQICKLIGTTKPTIAAIRDRTHPSSSTIKPRHPSELGLCTYQDLEDASRKGFRAMGKDPDEEAAKRLAESQPVQTEMQDDDDDGRGSAGRGAFAGFDFSNFMKKN